VPRRELILVAGLALVLAACGAAVPEATPPPEAPTPAAPTDDTPAPPQTPAPRATPTPEPATPQPATPVPATPTPAPPTPETGDVQVTIFDFGFDPAAVEIAVGTSVTWTNTGFAPHTVTFSDGPDSGSLGEGGTFEHTFESAGQFDYVCRLHPAMRGTITVGD
jgi:plastocyanin